VLYYKADWPNLERVVVVVTVVWDVKEVDEALPCSGLVMLSLALMRSSLNFSEVVISATSSVSSVIEPRRDRPTLLSEMAV